MTSQTTKLQHGSGSSPPLPADQLSVNLQIVSPSVGVNRPLQFPELPATFNLKQLKEKIRETLPLRPADDNQRLIHRGRALVKETDSLLEVFGEDILRAGEQVTIHLVIRDVTPSQPVPPPTTRGRSPAPRSIPTNIQQPNPSPGQLGPQPPTGFPRRNPAQPALHPFRGPSPSAANTIHDPANFQQQHQNMTSWLTQLQREAAARAIVGQNQRQRAGMGMRGIGDPTTQGQDANGRNTSPAPGQSFYREAVGPNGQVYQVETTIRSQSTLTANVPGGGLSPAEVHSILRNADISQVQATAGNSVRRSASSASMNSRFVGSGGSSLTAQFSSHGPRVGSGRATPDVGVRSVSAGSAASHPRPAYDVYILTSPEGPRALLVNNHTTETYYSPRLQTQRSFPHLANPISPAAMIFPQVSNTLPPQQPYAQPHQPQPMQQNGVQPPQPQEQAPPPVPGQVPPGAGFANLHNPNPAAGWPPLLVQAWPHLWMLFRLSIFVWFFTNPHMSWGRWLMIIGLAIFIFVFSLGGWNGLADYAWRGLTRLLEHLVPQLDQQNRRADGNAGQQAGVVGAQPPRNTNPAQLAARLFAERQEREGWLATQYRRVERATLLFMASLAPGIAERHIANLEAEAERLRRVEAEEAARIEAEAEAARSRANETEAATTEADVAEGATSVEAAQAATGELRHRQPDQSSTAA